MSARDLFRLSGGALLLGAIGLFVSSLLGAVLFPDQSNPTYARQSLFVLLNLLGAAGSALLLLGLPGLYVRWMNGCGTLGLAGEVLIALTLMLFGVFFSLQTAFIFPYIAEQAPQLHAGGPPPSFLPLFILGTLLSTVGPILLSVAMLRGRAPARWVGWVLLLSGVFSAASFFTNGPETPSSLLISLVNSASPLLGAIGLGGLGLLLLQPSEAAVASAR
jgi:hypothetical protein